MKKTFVYVIHGAQLDAADGEGLCIMTLKSQVLFNAWNIYNKDDIFHGSA